MPSWIGVPVAGATLLPPALVGAAELLVGALVAGAVLRPPLPLLEHAETSSAAPDTAAKVLAKYFRLTSISSPFGGPADTVARSRRPWPIEILSQSSSTDSRCLLLFFYT